MNDILRLLDDVSMLLGSPVKKGLHEYPQPTKQLLFADFLVNPGISYDINRLYHLYEDEPMNQHCLPIYGEEDRTTVLHGHTRERVCTAPSFCHISGYIPDPSHNPNFIRNFNLKWNKPTVVIEHHQGKLYTHPLRIEFK